MTPDELRALADNASPGPWKFLDFEPGVWDARNESLVQIEEYGECACFRLTEDARLIALAPTLARELADLREWADKAAEVMASGPKCPTHSIPIPDCSPLLNGCTFPSLVGSLLAEFDAIKERAT